METFFIRTFGCQMNEHDSERMAQLLCRAGLRPAASAGKADVVIVNSCSVRAKPQQKALSEAGRFQKARRQRGTRIVLAGCVAQQEGRALLERADWLDAVVGPDAVCRIDAIVERLARGERPLLEVDLHSREDPRFAPCFPGIPAAVCSQVTIMKGCDNFCSYCIVPLVRGREVSRPADDILREVEQLGRAGCREVTLLGQNVNSYRDGRGTNFPRLLRLLERQGAVERLRFTTSHPRDVDDEMIAALAECRRVCEHVHLGLQSGSDRILKLMNRGYRGQDFLDKVDRLRKSLAGVAITTDIIVGFPSESDDDFKDTMEVVRGAAFEQAFSFKYSPRPGTAAARMRDDVPAPKKAARLEELQRLLDDLEKKGLERMVGTVQEILVEGTSLRDGKAWRGRTRNGRVANFSAATEQRPGSFVWVRITEARGHTLWGGT